MLVETVGVGQVEVEIAGAADTTVVVVNPGWGDAVQANKAGLMEIADVFVINKADRPGVDETRRDLEQMLDLSDLGRRWRPPIVATRRPSRRGVAELWDAVTATAPTPRRPACSSGAGTRACATSSREIVTPRLDAGPASCAGGETLRAAARPTSLARRLDPWTAADEMLERRRRLSRLRTGAVDACARLPTASDGRP